MVFDYKKVMYSVVILLLLLVCHSIGYSQQVSKTVNYNAIFQPFGEGIHKEYLLPAEVKPEEHFQIRVNFDLIPEDIAAQVTGTLVFDQENGTLQIRGSDGILRSQGGIRLQGVIDIVFELELIPLVNITNPILIPATIILDQFIELPSLPISAEVPIPGFPQINKTWNDPQQFESLLFNGESVEVRGGIRKLVRVELQATDIVKAITQAATASAGVPLPPIAINALGVVFENGLGNAAISCNLGFLSTSRLSGKSIRVNGQQITRENQIITAPRLDPSQNSYMVNSSYEEAFTYQLDLVVSSDVWLEFNPLGIPIWSYPETVIVNKPIPIIEKHEVDLDFTSAQTIFPILQAEVAEPPVAVNTIPPQNLTVPGPHRPVDVARYFSSSNTLIYDAESNPRGILTARVAGSQVTITPLQEGSASVVVTAYDRDDRSLYAVQTIPVTVRSNRIAIVDQPSDDFTPPTTANPVVEGLERGVVVIVQNTGTVGVNIRSNPWVSNFNPDNRIGRAYDGATGRITDRPQTNNGFTWWNVEWDASNKVQWRHQPTDNQRWSVEAFGGSQLLFPHPPDLEVRFKVSDNKIEPGESFTLIATVENNGPGESAPTEIYFYYQKSDENTPRVAGRGKRDVHSLIENRSGVFPLSVDAPMIPGTYEYGAVLPPDIPNDYDANLVDPNRRMRLNNTDHEDVVVTSLPDLIVESISANKSTVDPGEEFRLDAVVRNQGIGEPSRSARLRYYRSRDARISKSDTEVGDNTIRSSDLGTNDTAERSKSITAPIKPGVYYYGAYVDLRFERNTHNNASSAIAITVRETGPPDLVVSTPTLSANTLPPGESLPLTTTVRNQGTGPAPATTLRVYRSSNANISNVDTEVGDVSIDYLRHGNTKTAQIRIETPLAAGTYYYGVCVDNVTHESNTVNNCSTGVALTVENLAPVAADTLTAETLVVGEASLLDVAPYFSDPNKDTLTYQPSSSSVEIVAVEMSGLSASHLRMNPLAVGTATVTVKATDPSGLSSPQTFSVTVNPPPNRAPVAIGGISPETLMAQGASKVVDVSGLFHDVDGDTLGYTVSSDNTRVVSVSISGTQVTLTPVSEGSATVRVTASDGELRATLSISVSITPYVDAEAWMPDANLRARVSTALGLQPNEVLTQQVMEGLIILNATNRTGGTGVQNLTGLEHATQLTILILRGTGVRNLTPLQGLTQLTQLNLAYTETRDLRPLQGLPNLTRLNLHQTGPWRISSLQDLTQLTHLDIGRTNIRDLTPLQELTALTSLDLSFNNSINFTNPHDLTPLSGLTALTSLNLGYTNISDITALEGLTNLTHLNLRSNQISDISILSGLTALTELGLQWNQISDVSPLEALTSLKFLRLQGNSIADSAPLRRLKEKNPRLSIDIKIETKAPDLRVASVSVNKNTVAPGEVFQLTGVIQNRGEADSTATPLRYYLSTDDTISDTNTEVHATILPTVTNDATRELSTELTAPDTPGIYYYEVCVDAVEHESDTTNNCSIGISVTVSGADLVINSVRVEKPTVSLGERSRLTAEVKDRGEDGSLDTPDRSALSTVAPGEQFRVNVSIQNRGKADSTAATLRYYFSADENISPEDTEVQTATLPIVAADAMRESSVQLTAPDTPGVYYYGVCVDAVTGESDVTNNCSTAVAVTVENTGIADFVVESVRANKTTVKPGENFQISIVVRNQGVIASTATVLRYYLSTDEDISTADTEVQTATLPIITDDATRQQSRQFTAPNTPGTYYYGVCVDAMAGESDTSNNCSVAVAVTVGGADLRIDSTPQVSKTTLSPGETFQINTRVWNQGSATSDVTTLRYYLSTDDTISVDDTEVDSERVDPLSGKGAHASRRRMELSKTLTAPDTPGDYYYGVCVDSVAGDADTSNNCSPAIAVTVEAPPPEPIAVPVPDASGNPESVEIQGPDLVFSMTRVDASTIKPGQGVRLHITIENQGTRASPATIIRYYRSTDATITAEDTELRAVPVGQLGSGKSQTTWGLLPSPFSVGVYYYGACVDGVDSEFDTSNNCSDAIEITVEARGTGKPQLSPVGTISTQALEVSGSPMVLNVSGYFFGEVETWTASSNKTDVVTVSISGSEVTLTPVGEGWATVTVTASSGDLAAKQTFSVSVGGAAVPEPEPVVTSEPEVSGPDLSAEVSIPDENLRAAVRSALGLEQGDTITQQKMLRLGHLNALNRGINDLTGLEHAKQLKYLNISVNQISNITALQNLTELTTLESQSNRISDITPLKNLNALTKLTLNGNNQISDITPLKNLTGIRELWIHNDQITDLTPLQNLTGITSLIIGGTRLSNITPIQRLTSLTYLSLTSSPNVNNITPLQNLTALTTLLIYNNKISDITPLQNLTELKHLESQNNQINSITSLQNLTGITNLYLDNNKISSITPLQNLTGITNLTISGNQISSITPLQNLIALTQLQLQNNQISDITPLQNLIALTELLLSQNQISDVDSLEGLTSLRTLWLSGNPIEDLAPLRTLKENNPSVRIDIDINADVQEAPSVQVLPDETALLSNYPNPFNPETWIPYQLSTAVDVSLTIYDVRGVVVRQLALGHRPAGFYYSRGRAVHWDGRNQLGEKVASGLYFYTFTAGDFTATRKMLIRK